MILPPDPALLACPRCRAPLRSGADLLACAGCAARFPVAGGVPDLLPWSGGEPGPEWATWREKLEALRQWRRGTWDGSRSSASRQAVADDRASLFFRHARLPEGRILEVGCGSAQLRGRLPGREYWGLDPLAGTPEAPRGSGGPPFVLVRGVGERLPFASCVFDGVMICETLDHALDPARVLDEASRVLKAAGVLAVMQSVREPSAPAVAWRVRARATAGRFKARLLGRSLPPSDDGTKMRALRADEVEEAVRRLTAPPVARIAEGTLYLRAVKPAAAVLRAERG